jgi:hypothetical protein
MAVITNYTTLQTAVTDNLARSDLSTFVPNFIQQWEERFYRESQNWGSWMEAALNVTIAASVAAVPSDHLAIKVAYISGQNTPPLKRIGLEQLYARFPRSGSTGVPVYFARNGANFEFGPIPTGGAMVGTYYAKPTVLRTDSDGINWLITNAPDLCLYGALLEAEVFIKEDARLLIWREFYNAALDAYRSQMRAEDYSGAAPHTVAG